MSRRKAAAKHPATRRSPRASSAGMAEGALREDIAVEAFAALRHLIAEFGVKGAAQQRAVRRSAQDSTTTRISGPLLRDSAGLGALLLEWSKAPAYVDASGRPKVLAVKGAGLTFEGLVRRHLPKSSLKKAVDLACRAAEVAPLPGGRIALVGGVMVNVLRANDTVFFAHGVRQIVQLLSTLAYNRRHRASPTGHGRLERIVLGVVPRGDAAAIIDEFRPQIYDLFQRIEAAMDARLPKSNRDLKQATTLSVSLFVAQEDNLERVGLDGLELLTRKPPT